MGKITPFVIGLIASIVIIIFSVWIGKYNKTAMGIIGFAGVIGFAICSRFIGAGLFVKTMDYFKKNNH